MLKEHWLFFSIISIALLYIVVVTIENIQTTGYSVAKIQYCVPMKCETRGMEPGKFYCDAKMCYRNCYQNGVLIEKATFCEK